MSGNFTYIPAVSPATFRSCVKKIGLDKAKKMFWWLPEGFFQHKCLLISAFYGMKMDRVLKHPIRKELYVPKSIDVWGDSGGFQARELGEIITNETVLDWYENNCDYAFVQDYPEKFIKLRKQLKNHEIDLGEDDLHKKMAEFQAESNVDFIKAKLTKCKIYNILHGRNLDQIENWFDTTKNDKMYGWAFSISVDIFSVAFVLAYLYNKGIKKNIHVFGCSGLDVIPIIAYASKWIENITFDSSSWSIGARYKKFFNPLNIRGRVWIGNNSTSKYSKLPCNCPVCSNITNASLMYKGNAISSMLLSLHNLYYMLWYTDRLRDFMQVETDYRDIVKFEFNEEVNHALDYLDLAMVDFAKANRKFGDRLDHKKNLFHTVEKYEQGSFEHLFGESQKEEIKEEEEIKDLEEVL